MTSTLLAGTLLGHQVQAKEPTPGFNTKIPECLLTPDKSTTRARDIEFFDGIPTASLEAIGRSQQVNGETNPYQVRIFDQLMDSNSLFLTGNTDTVYMSAVLDLKKDGATVNTPAMTWKRVGKGSQYAWGVLDKNGDYLDGSKNYKLTLPADPPAKNFASIVLYDLQTRSQLQTSQPFPSYNSEKHKDVYAKNEDGSVDMYFGPEPPEGKESNWSRPYQTRASLPSCASTAPQSRGSIKPGVQMILSC
ncbi:DUF1214 domain-containing protein [Phaeobacter gallaeciensis]|uniref:DUF1214 domain-containing protein n=1 Tax=Phaeobacter gallaeciensis TaxID=60890 RepID=UPI001C692457|nr:DUF1214 domain-containing protein [Phaeobacter gallaeciensis]